MGEKVADGIPPLKVPDFESHKQEETDPRARPRISEFHQVSWNQHRSEAQLQ